VDLIAVGRKILNNPGWPMDAALKLGSEGPFRRVPQFDYWLGTRANGGFGIQPLTWQANLAGEFSRSARWIGLSSWPIRLACQAGLAGRSE
jgi:hypothetical protein